MTRRTVAALLCCLLCAQTVRAGDTGQGSTDTTPGRSGFAQLDVAASIFGKLLVPDRAFSNLTLTFRGGWRGRHVDLSGSVGLMAAGDETIDPGVRNDLLNIGVGVGVRYFADRMRTAVSLGPSILMSQSVRHCPGTTGFFLDVRPAGFRIPLRTMAFEIQPLGFSVLAPILSEVPLVYLVFYTAVAVELRFANRR
jgi:hypothetical protein